MDVKTVFNSTNLQKNGDIAIPRLYIWRSFLPFQETPKKQKKILTSQKKL